MATGLIGVVAAALGLGYRLYVTPVTDPLPADGPADAVVALGGLPSTAAYGAELVRQGRGRQLVVSNPYRPSVHNAATQLCEGLVPIGRPVRCFFPDPGTTRGEGQEIRRLAATEHWRTVVVLAPRYHVSRARFIIDRCFAPGARPDLRYVATPHVIPDSWWPYQFAYQSAGFVKAVLIHPDC